MAKRDSAAAKKLAPVTSTKAAARVSPARAELTTVAGDAASPLALDRLIHERIRLAIVSTLAVHDMLTFNELKALLATTDGNLSVHARKLEDAHYIACRKGYDGRIPRTEYRLTTVGRQALERYLSHMEALIRRVGEGA